MEYIVNYIQPELLILVPVLFFLGHGLKAKFPNLKETLPLILPATGMLMSYVWGMGWLDLNYYNPFMILFMSITQGIITGGLAVWGYETFKRFKK